MNHPLVTTKSARKSFTPLRTWFLAGLPFLIIAFLLVLFFYDVIFFGKTLSTSSLLPGTTPQGPYEYSGHRPELPFSFDTGGNAWVNEPNPYIIRNVLKRGGLPDWSPYEGLGMPLIANTNNEVLNPLKLLLNLFPGPFAQDIFFLLRLLVMGFFTYLFLREMKLSAASSLLGSSFFMLSGYPVWWINLHPLSTVMYLPAVFYFYERWSNRAELKSAFFMSLSLSLSLVAGKIPDVIMGLCLLSFYALWKGFTADSLRGTFREGGKIIAGTAAGALMASVVLLPFFELYARASPLAKAIRTGAASHTIPLISSVSLFEPLFLGWKNYFYGSWLKWTPDVILPHAGMVIAVLSLYAVFQKGILKKTFPCFIFSLTLFSLIYGLLPSHIISSLPVLGSIEFLKYNAMFYFSLAIMSAAAFDHLLSAEGEKKKFYLCAAIVCLLVLTYFFRLYGGAPQRLKGYMIAVLFLSLSGVVIMALVLHISRGKQLFGGVVLLFMISELFLYMPKDHPDRVDPYKEPPYLHVIKEESPYRFSGGGNIMPPLVSNALGLYDTRAVSVLLPGDYYTFFENLLSFSVPQTNNPNPIFLATSPYADLVGVKYILSREPLESSMLDDEVKAHLRSLRWIRFFNAMISHTIKGGSTYGFLQQRGEERFCFFFPLKFVIKTKLLVSEPFLFAGFALKDASEGSTVRVRISVGDETSELPIEAGRWNDRWMDVSRYEGKVMTLVIEGDGSGRGSLALGDFGLSPGYERERILYDNLLTLHKKEFDFLKYLGAYEGVHIYENRNVMHRAFVLHRTKAVKDLAGAIKELQEGTNFREVGLVTAPIPGPAGEGLSSLAGAGKDGGDKIVIRKYVADEAAIEVESKGGLLVLSDLYYPGWKVRVNGKEDKIVRVFGLLRGVFVGNGKSEVLFYYRPDSLYKGIVVTAATFVAWIAFLMISRKRPGSSQITRGD